jgi:uncharacterized protein (TIGR00730 family)
MAEQLGRRLAQEKIGVVYGAGGVGVMGALSDAVLDAGGELIGVIPRALMDRERGRPDLPDLRVVGSMHERKALMHELADAYLVLPGGLGTLEELLEVTTWAQLGLHRKPIVVLDIEGYYRPLMALLDHGVAEGFVTHRARSLLRQAPTIEAALRLLRVPMPEPAGEWLDGPLD